MSLSSTSTILANLHRVMAVQAWSKVLTFVCNVFIVRLVDPSTYGRYAVELTLALNVTLFVSRDALRNVTGRFDRSPSNTRAAFAVSLLVLPVGVVVAAIVALGLQPRGDAYLALGVMLSSALLELAAEPCLAVLHCQLLLSERLKLDAIGTSVRCAVVLSLLISLAPSVHLLAFAVGQLAYAAVLFAGVLLAVRRHDLASLCVPSQATALWRVHAPLLRAFYWQSLQQMVLTEAEKVALWFGASGFDQGTFAVVSNLGSLVARLVFLPVEETSKAVFQRERDRRRSGAVLALLVKLVMLVGLVVAAFGPAYSRTLLHLLYGERISATSAPLVLQFYSVYILFMAVNGVSEAFVHATADQAQLRVVNTTMLAFSAVYIVLASALLYAFGTVGLVVANCINMVLRVSFSTRYALQRFGADEFSVRQCLPSASLTLAFVSAIATTQLSRVWLEPSSLVAHIGVGAVAFGAVLGAAYLRERQFVRDLRAITAKKAD